MINRRFLYLLVALTFGAVCLIGSDRPVAAHAVLVDATPASNSTIPGPDVDVNLHFNLRIDRARSRLTLVFPDGKTIALNSPTRTRRTGSSRGRPTSAAVLTDCTGKFWPSTVTSPAAKFPSTSASGAAIWLWR